MEIFLTFDDGIQAGTEEVLEVLRETGVKATFFLIGNELRYSYEQAPSRLLALLKEIYDHHDIGNHSYSHANFRYANYYLNNGVQTCNRGGWRSILADFEKGQALIDEYLKMANRPSGNRKNIRIARFPGRNTFHTFSSVRDKCGANGLYRYEEKTEERAKELAEAGYNIYGWDVGWEMSFEFHKDAVALKNLRENTTTFDYGNEKDVYPCLDMYCSRNIQKDRLTEDWPSVINKIEKKAVQSDKVILLMHDRAFRRGIHDGNVDTNGSCNSESHKLWCLITQLKGMQAEFKGLADYWHDASSDSNR